MSTVVSIVALLLSVLSTALHIVKNVRVNMAMTNDEALARAKALFGPMAFVKYESLKYQPYMIGALGSIMGRVIAEGQTWEDALSKAEASISDPPKPAPKAEAVAPAEKLTPQDAQAAISIVARLYQLGKYYYPYVQPYLPKGPAMKSFLTSVGSSVLGVIIALVMLYFLGPLVLPSGPQPHPCTCGCEVTGHCVCPNCSVGCGFLPPPQQAPQGQPGQPVQPPVQPSVQPPAKAACTCPCGCDKSGKCLCAPSACKCSCGCANSDKPGESGKCNCGSDK